jgi:hypothetical protein
MIVKHYAINTKNQELVEGKEYLYSEYNYPFNSTLVYCAIVTIKNIINNETGVGFDVIPVRLFRSSSDKLRVFKAFQNHSVSDMWNISDLNTDIDTDDLDLYYFAPTQSVKIEQKHLLKYLNSDIIENKEYTSNLLPIFEKHKECLDKFKIKEISLKEITTNAVLQIIFLLNEAIQSNDDKLIKKYTIWLRFAFVKSIVTINEWFGRWLEKYEFHYIEPIDNFIKHLQSNK